MSDTVRNLSLCFSVFLEVRPCLESHATAVVSPPIDLGPHLASLLKPEADIKIKHGVIGLLRHLAYVSAARTPLCEAGTIERLVASNVFSEISTIAELVQVSAIGVVKHLCNGNGTSFRKFPHALVIDHPFQLTLALLWY